MDFHTMVSSFRRTVLEGKQEEIEELSTQSRQRVKSYIDQGTPGRHTPRHSFNHIFGDETTMRIAIPMGNQIEQQGTLMLKRFIELGWKPAFVQKTIQQVLRRRVGDPPPGWSPGDDDPRPVEEYTVDKEIPDLQMAKDEEVTIPKGPRAGEKITRTKKISLGKLLARIGTEEEKAWWQENQNSLREMRNVQKIFLSPWLNDFHLLARPMIIITRHPVDVARMSDFSTTRSCHSEGSSHFECAIAESKGHGMVAYAVKAKDWEKIKDRLDDDEIFADADIGLDGVEPVGRVRIRKLFNTETEAEFALPEKRVYGVEPPDFLPTIRKWARDTQKDIWADEEGDMSADAIDATDWVLVGGEYEDHDPGHLLQTMFEDTEWEDEAFDAYGRMLFRHEDYYGEGAEALADQAETRLGEIQERANDSDHIKHGSVWLNIDEGWDEHPFFASGQYTVSWKFSFSEEWEDSDRFLVPTFRDSWELRRNFINLLDKAFESTGEYTGYNNEWESEEGNNEIIITYREDAELTTSGMDSIDELEEWVDYRIQRELDEKWAEIKYALRRALIEEEYLPPGVYERAAKELPPMEFTNLAVEYDEDDPAEGIVIKPKEEYILVGLYKTHDEQTGQYIDNSQWGIRRLQHGFSGAADETINARVRAAFKRLSRAAAREAKKQLTMPFTRGVEHARQIEMPFTPPGPDPRYQPPSAEMPDMPLEEFQFQFVVPGSTPELLKVGFRFEIKIGVEVNEATYEIIKAFVDYLDKNISVLQKAAKLIVDQEAEVTSEMHHRKSDQTGPVVRNARGERMTEAKLREAIRRAIKKSMLKEQTGFETRLFQVNLRIQIDPDAGGGIEQKLNRIRAIQGVTVVGHEESEKLSGRRTIEAKVKFHPESDASRPSTYITQILVPEINSSKHVPGVKVIDVVKGTLKRLDK